MKKFLLGSVGLTAMLAGPAMAADMPIKAPPPPPVVYYDWSGAYIGFNTGSMV
jgi:outer membrane immunogenic protein